MHELIIKISNIFKKYGVKSVTMDDIAHELGISKKTLYQHFENKNDIINKVAQYEMKNECDELAKLCTLHSNAIEQLLMISKHIISKLYNLNPLLTYSMNKYYPLIWEKFLRQRKEYPYAFKTKFSDRNGTGHLSRRYQYNRHHYYFPLFLSGY